MKTKLILALEHALDRLNSIPHNYKDTNFMLIEDALQTEYVNKNIPSEKRMCYLRKE